ncbi:hypothetical protein GEV39_21985 [Pseudomonas sp. NY5710]|uniref:hypothetical protein n=1 Tax=Pseudomonas sp. NY5710 TaxID=2662033 RepID=UPI0015714939|nr:hypothetical protein [Pseudomonas sp. NY5710]QKL03869.1 hypothetical protein GEV39_21985 [Pseudomonas sp. NY5710]
MSDPVILPVEDFPIGSLGETELLQMLQSSPLIQVRRSLNFTHGLCYWDVVNFCKVYGGSMVQGWQITRVPTLYIEATHHAIWRSPSGELVDLNEPAPGTVDPKGFTTFSICAPIKIDLNWPVLIENKHVLLSDDPRVDQALTQYRLNNRANVSLRDEAKKLYWKWSVDGGWVPDKRPNRTFREANDQMVQTYDSLHDLRAQLLRDYFQG